MEGILVEYWRTPPPPPPWALKENGKQKENTTEVTHVGPPLNLTQYD